MHSNHIRLHPRAFPPGAPRGPEGQPHKRGKLKVSSAPPRDRLLCFGARERSSIQWDKLQASEISCALLRLTCPVAPLDTAPLHSLPAHQRPRWDFEIGSSALHL